MKETHVCTEKACAEKGGKPFALKFAPEALMDKKNVADFFCPRCGHKLVPVDPEPESDEKA